MSRHHLIIACAIGIAIGLLDARHFAAARGGLGAERPLADDHINNLPSDIQRAVFKRELACGGKAAAAHYFAVSIDASGHRFVSLHFEDFACVNRGAVCNAAGCLHEVYLKTRGGYRLVFNAYADELKMTNSGGSASLEITRGGSNALFQWTGRSFIPSRKAEKGSR